MSVPYHLLAGLDMSYNLARFLKCEIWDIKGMLETVHCSIDDHARHFPKDKTNVRYFNSFARRISYLEDEVDSWKYWAFQLLEEVARYEVNTLRSKVFGIMTKMGPAAEAYHFSISPVWNWPKVITHWHQISLTKVRKFKKASKQVRKQALEAKAEA